VVGMDHSANPQDLMYRSARAQEPTQNDLDACNRAVEQRFGVKPLPN